MGLRTLYLKRYLSINGRASLAGRKLYDRFKETSDDCLLAHAVMSDESAGKIKDPRVAEDIVAESLVRKLDPNLIYIEGGLFLNEDEWRVPGAYAKTFAQEGGVLVIADVEINQAREHKDGYRAAHDLTGVSIDYGQNDADSPVYAIDQRHFSRFASTIVVSPQRMSISDWLRPVYDGISEIVVGSPVRLASWDFDNLLISGNSGSTGTLQDDIWVDKLDSCVFGSAHNYGSGFVVLLAGAVSGDVYTNSYPDNITWLTNLGSFLAQEASSERRRNLSHLRSPYCLFLSHRRSDADFVATVADSLKRAGKAVWLDRERLVPSVSLWGEISSGLDEMTHFVLFWSAACLDGAGVTREWRAAAMTERNIPIIIVRLDQAPVPAVVADLFRIEALGLDPSQTAARISDAVDRLAAG
jgi:hypothetical protein